jgi:hypothetical protein
MARADQKPFTTEIRTRERNVSRLSDQERPRRGSIGSAEKSY